MKNWKKFLIIGLVLLLVSVLACGPSVPQIAQEDLNFEIQVELYTLNNWTKNPNDANRGSSVVFSGRLEISDQQKFLELTDPENFETEGLTRKEIIDLLVKQKIIQETALPIWALEFDSRQAFAAAVSESENLKGVLEIQEFISQKTPWYWTLGPVKFQALYKKAVETPTELQFKFEQMIIKAQEYNTFMVGFLPPAKKTIQEHEKLIEIYKNGDEVFRLGYGEGKILFEEFLAGLGDEPLKALAAMDKEMFIEATDNFLASLEEKPSIKANNIFVFMVVNRWLKAHLQVHQEIFENSLYPFFTKLPQYQNPANVALWQIAIGTSLLNLPEEKELRGRLLERIFSQWLQNEGIPLLKTGLPESFEMAGVAGIKDFTVEISKNYP